MSIAAIYARYSSDLQRDTSIEDQIRVARRYAHEQGLTIDDSQIYTDAGISGASIHGRPGLQALLASAGRTPRPFDVVLVDDSSRVARDIADAIRFLQNLTFLGARVVYISQHIDSAQESAETLVAVHGVVDSLYLKELAKKVRRGLEGQQARGFATGGKTFGYRTVPVVDPSGRRDPATGGPALLGHRVEIDEGEALTVQRIFEWYAAGDGYSVIVGRLNRQGPPASRGGRWHLGAVKRILTNERYLGRHILGQVSVERRPGTKQKLARRVPRDRWKVQERPELRIVSDDLWASVRRRQADVRRAFGVKGGQNLARGKTAIYSRYLFSGLMRCGTCSRAIGVVSSGKAGPRYGCSAAYRSGATLCTNRVTVSAPVADAALLAGLRAELTRPEIVEDIVAALSAALNAVIDTRPAARATIEAGIANARRKLQHLVDAIETGASAPTLLEAILAREAEIVRLQGELTALDEPLDEKLAVMPSWVRAQLDDVVGLLTDRSDRTKAQFRDLGVRFTLHPMGKLGESPYYRAEGETDMANVIAGQFTVAATGRLGGRAAAVRSLSPAPYTNGACAARGASQP
jgi:DNA invertase Pin-like site-specific DNA recombinase